MTAPVRSPRRRASAAVAWMACCVLVGCQEGPTSAEVDPGPETPTDERVLANPDWTERTHGKTDPDYARVFPQDSVNRVDITMTAAQWQAIRADMVALWGFDFGEAMPGTPPAQGRNPEYVDVTVRFGGKRWNHVGFRLKGHQSLFASWRAGSHKLPFRLHFDRFEDTLPTVRDQRFHGFKELSMAPGYSDPSLMRDRLAAGFFQTAGVPAAETAFYRVFIDFGEGPRYCGLYTMVEVIDDTMVKRAFGSDDGNIYKPESSLTRFRAQDFEKKNNKSAADWSDVEALVETLNSPTRTSDPEAWRTALEGSFDVDHFLRWLAVSNVLVNKDSYGDQGHNYYLYAHPERGLVWIPWDHNLALEGSPGISGDRGSSREGRSLVMNEVDADWPLIRYLMDDPVYRGRYETHLADASVRLDLDGAPARVDALAVLIRPFVLGADGEQPGHTQLADPSAFPLGVSELRRHLLDRRALLARYLAGER